MVVIIVLLLQFNLHAQDVPPITLHVEAGSLKSQLGARTNDITDLTLTGNLNGDDIKTIRGMTNLSILNIKGANIVEGGGYYTTRYSTVSGETYYYYTSNNILGESMFRLLSKLKSVTIPDNIIRIEDGAFYGCKGLTSIVVPDGVTSIYSSAFSGCSSLTSITIPNSITTIGGWAFQDCIGLIDITIPSDVTFIGFGTFQGCTGLTSITIPFNITSISSYAFSGCTGLKKIHSKNPTPPTIQSNSFEWIDKTSCKLYVPKESYSAYWWAWGFDNIIEEEESSIYSISKDNISIQPILNGISIDVKEQTSISIYSLSGQIVYQSDINGYTEIGLNRGVYIVRVDNESQKVIVK
ncbi:leucine-rich repeat domain-containing protein [Dysgonomonas sp. 520]|uniref:leucine-rich repeat domain-containing protein n=1 Tax=Dysgonomonas sp. 520 TaxID=2302931 RepID=UPI0013D320EF|nr:leucine-rich repeat domain-containing protein [Dysgonomonas sp. 520]